MSKQVCPIVLTEEPLQNLLTLSETTLSPLRMELEKGVQVYGYTAIIFVLGLTCLKKLAIELTKAPPPDGTKT
jgi:hypothetical protein